MLRMFLLKPVSQENCDHKYNNVSNITFVTIRQLLITCKLRKTTHYF